MRSYTYILLLLVVSAVHFLEHGSIYTYIRINSAANPDVAAAAILAQPLAAETANCPNDALLPRHRQLARAVMLVENSLINPAERVVETVLVRWLTFLVNDFDISVGPAQIKPSSFKESALSAEDRISKAADVCGALATIAERVGYYADQGDRYDSRRRFYDSHTGIHAEPIYNAIYANLVDTVFYTLLADSP